MWPLRLSGAAHSVFPSRGRSRCQQRDLKNSSRLKRPLRRYHLKLSSDTIVLIGPFCSFVAARNQDCDLTNFFGSEWVAIDRSLDFPNFKILWNKYLSLSKIFSSSFYISAKTCWCKMIGKSLLFRGLSFRSVTRMVQVKKVGQFLINYYLAKL